MIGSDPRFPGQQFSEIDIMKANGFSTRNELARMATRRSLLVAIAAVLLSIPIFAGLSFVPDSTFKDSNLNGWRPLGDASWHAQAGEITGAVKAGRRRRLAVPRPSLSGCRFPRTVPLHRRLPGRRADPRGEDSRGL